MTDAHIAHAPQDAAWVRWFAGRLREAGLQVTDGEVLYSPGALIVSTIERAIRESRHGILVFSRHALADPWTREAYETLMRRAIENGRRFIPVLIEDVPLPEFAANRFHVDLSGAEGPDLERRLATLIAILRGAEPPSPDPGERPGARVRPEKPIHCTLRISPDQVTVLVDGEEAGRHRPEPRPRLDDLLRRLRSARKRHVHSIDEADAGGIGTLLAEVGRELGHAYLNGPAGRALAARLARAAELGCGLRLGLEVAEELTDLPWETVIPPGDAMASPGGEDDPAALASGAPPGRCAPLALQPQVQLFRQVTADTTTAISIPGPLRILAVLAAPDGPGSGPLPDLEAELAKILDSVERARSGLAGRPGAYVRVLNQGSLAAIREALLQERFHVLHISCHAGPGVLLLEDEAGRVDRVTTERFVAEGLPAGRGVPLLVLSGCSTALTARPGQTTRPGAPLLAPSPPGERSRPGRDQEERAAAGRGSAATATELAGLARGLTAAGVPAVLAMTAPVTDRYATALAGSLYYELAVRDAPEVLPAFCDARRRLEEERRRASAGTPEAAPEEWATPALFLRGPSLRLYDAADGFERITAPADPAFADGVPLRRVGEFVGRRTEIRAMTAALRDGPGVLLHGIGGVGKSSLAAELLRRLGPDAGLIVSAVSETSPDQVLDELGRTLLTASDDENARRLAVTVRDPRHEWTDRLTMLAPLLAQAPVTLLLDNFEDNLRHDGTAWRVRNPELADFLTAWIRRTGRHRLLITSRYPFPLPRRAERRLVTWHLGPLSWAETRNLMWRLPALNDLSPEERQQAWAMVGGHPRTLEYLDALLRGGRARFPDVRERLEDLLDRRGIVDPAAWLRGAGRGLDAALAEAVTLAVDDSLLGDLLGLLDDFTRAVLVGASVYRRPVDRTGVAWPVSTPAEPDPEREKRLERWDGLLRKAQVHNPRAWLDDLGLSAEELAQARADVAAWQTPPIIEPDGLEAAIETLAGLGLLAVSGEGSGAGRSFLVHRWTAATLAAPGLTAPEQVRRAHEAAAAYRRWRVETRSQAPQYEVADLLEARHHSYASGNLRAAAEATTGACRHLVRWGAWSWAEQLYAETASWLPERSREHVDCRMELGNIALRQGRYDRALECYRQALAVFEELGDRAGMARGHHRLGVIAQLQGEYDQALEHYRRSLTISEELGDRADMACVYHQLGTIAQKRGEHDQALHHYRRSLAIREELGDRAGMARGYHQLGVIAQERGEYDRALGHYRQALTICEELGDRAGMAPVYHNLGVIAQERGEHDQALHHYRRSLTICEELGDRAGMADTYSQLGALYTETGEAAAAVPYTLHSLAIRGELRLPTVVTDLRRLGRQRQALGEREFTAILSRHLAPATVTALLDRLDRHIGR